jgi:hypothetical protein
MSSSNNQIMICNDGHRCEHGSICTEKPDDEGGFFCDCDESSFDTVYSGVYCQHVATSYCTFNQEVSRMSFCTNAGECKVEVSPDEAHLGCDCKTGYEGDHCQFVEGTMPDNWPVDSNNLSSGNQSRHATDEGLHGGVIAVIILIVLAFIGSIGFLIYRKKKAHSTPLTSVKNNIESASELSLDADGGELKESIKVMSTSTLGNGTGTGTGTGSTGSVTDVEQNGEALEDIQLSGSQDASEAIII